MNITEEFKGKTALVTGASRGIGRATAFALARRRARLIVHFNESVAPARELVTAIRAEGGDADAIRADLSTQDGTTSLASSVAGRPCRSGAPGRRHRLAFSLRRNPSSRSTFRLPAAYDREPCANEHYDSEAKHKRLRY